MFRTVLISLAWFFYSSVAFVPSILIGPRHTMIQFTHHNGLRSARRTKMIQMVLQPIDSEMEGVPIPFVDRETNTFIDCFADSYCTLEGTVYTIGVPCDTAVALCKMMDDEELVPIEEDELNDVFSIAAAAIEEEFDEELVLQRTPQTLTLVGELEDEFDDDDDEHNGYELDGVEMYDSDGEDIDDDEAESVEVLLSFEHRGENYALVRLLDPVLLVGVMNEGDDKESQKRYLLSVEESDRVMPKLEDMFSKYNEARAKDDDIEDFTEVLE